MNIKVGDIVLDKNDHIGFIKKICDCDKCKERGWFEPEIYWVDNPDKYDFISDVEYKQGLEKRFNKIGDYVFHFSEQKEYKKPPLGLKPRKIHDYQRAKDIIIAMERYTEDDQIIPSEWIEELRDLLLRYE